MSSEESVLESLINNISAAEKNAQNNTREECLVGDSTVETVIKALAYFIILIVSLVGNILLILVIHKNKQLRKSINYFVFNMAVSDLFNPLTIMPIRIAQIISGSGSWNVDNPWILGNILCKLSYFLPDVSLVVSIESLLLVSMDRFVAVVFPLKAKLISPKARLISIGCAWLVAIAVHTSYFYTFRLLHIENKTYCKSDWGPLETHTEKRYFMANFIAFIIIPVCLLAMMYGFIACTLKTKNKKSKERLSSGQRKRDQQLKKIVRLSVAIIIAFGVCTIPVLVFTFTLIFLWNWKVPAICAYHNVIPFICLFMLHLWSAVNPCICFIFNKKYRNGFQQIPSLLNNCRTSAEEESRRMPTGATSIYGKRLSKTSAV